MPIVIKYGGNAMTDPATRREVAKEIYQLAKEVLLAHSGSWRWTFYQNRSR